MYKTNNNDEITPNKKLVNNVLAKHPKLAHLKGALTNNIVTLDDDLLKEQGLDVTLDLLLQHSRIDLLIEKIKKTKPTEAPLPRSLRIKIDLTSPLEATREAQEFKTLQSEAENAKLHYQQKIRQLIVKTLILDQGTLKQQLRESFYKHISNLIETKIFYELQMMPNDNAVSKIFKEKGGSKTASAYTCLKIFETQHGTPNHELDLNLEKLSTYLDTRNDTIKEGILTRFNKEETDKIITTQTNLCDETIQQLQQNIIDIFDFCANEMTTDTLSHHKEKIKKRNAIATTEATFNNKKTEETTSAVATALANKGSMSTKTMEAYIDKRIQENLAKNFQCGSKPQKHASTKPSKRGQEGKNGKPTKKRKEFDGKGKEERGRQTNKKPQHPSNPNNKANREEQDKRGKKQPPRYRQNKNRYQGSKNKSWTRTNTSKNRKRGSEHQEELHNGGKNKKAR